MGEGEGAFPAVVLRADDGVHAVRVEAQQLPLLLFVFEDDLPFGKGFRITSYNVCYTKLLRCSLMTPLVLSIVRL